VKILSIIIAATVLTVASFSLGASSGDALAEQKSAGLSSDNISASQTQPAQLTCVDSEKRKGYPKQKFFVKEVDGQRAGTVWSGLRRTVELQPGKRKVTLRHIFSLLYRDLDFSFDAESGKKYICTGRFDSENNFIVEIRDGTSKALIAEPASSSCIHLGQTCTD
jgi:hypothetical protein